MIMMLMLLMLVMVMVMMMMTRAGGKHNSFHDDHDAVADDADYHYYVGDDYADGAEDDYFFEDNGDTGDDDGDGSDGDDDGDTHLSSIPM